VEDLTLAAERQRLARELHDTLAQGLAGLILQLEAVDSHLARGGVERAQAIVRQAMTRARLTLADARRAISDLRAEDALPADLDQAIRDEVERFTAATGLPCDLDLQPLPALPERLREQAFRTVTEGLTNIAHHARAQRVTVQVASRDGALEVKVWDDGVGFDPLAVSEQVGHYGLVGLRERARLAGGSLTVTSTPGQGTTIGLRLPLAEPAHG
jgi:NarL family two-component system sensor histidine kinase YdfH